MQIDQISGMNMKDRRTAVTRAQLKESEVREILHEGARKARAVARKTLEEARERIGVGKLLP